MEPKYFFTHGWGQNIFFRPAPPWESNGCSLSIPMWSCIHDYSTPQYGLDRMEIVVRVIGTIDSGHIVWYTEFNILSVTLYFFINPSSLVVSPPSTWKPYWGIGHKRYSNFNVQIIIYSTIPNAHSPMQHTASVMRQFYTYTTCSAMIFAK